MSWCRRVELKLACILLLVVTVTFFNTPRFIIFAETALSLSSVKEPYCCYNASEWTNLCAYQTFSEIEGQQAYSGSFFCYSSNGSQSFFHFSLHSFVFQCTVKVCVLYKNNFLYANYPFHSLWSRVLKYQLECDKVQWLKTHCGQALIFLGKSLSKHMLFLCPKWSSGPYISRN